VHLIGVLRRFMGCARSALCAARNDSNGLGDNMVWVRTDRFEDFYKVEQVIGEGSLGIVAKVNRLSSNETYAMKSIMFSRVKGWMETELLNEISILRSLDHPNIVRPQEVFRAKRQICLVMELCKGGDLYEHALWEERQSKRIIRQIVSALSFCHAKNVIHRDIKFENIMFEEDNPHSNVKLLDFGLSKQFSGGERMKKVVGTIYSMAPEVLAGDYSCPADMWSIGVIAYMLLSGTLPFDGPDQNSVAEKVRRGKYSMTASQWNRVSAEAKEFIDSCLCLDPSKRLTADEALASSWLASSVDQAVSTSTGQDLVDSMSNFSKASKLKKTALMVMAHQASSNSLEELRKAFNGVDTANNGVISEAEFRSLVKKYLPEHDAAALFATVDVGKTGTVQYREFLAATLEAKGLIREEALAAAFDRLDSDNTGFISRANLKSILGTDWSPEMVDEMINEADIKKNGQIDFEEFLVLMRKEQRVLGSSRHVLATGDPSVESDI